jgi:dGTPase
LASDLRLKKITDFAWCRHPLAFLVEAADDICYSIIDLEDGCRLGLVSVHDTVELIAGILKNEFRRDKLEQIPGTNEKIGVLRALAINKLVEECTQIFLDSESRILDGNFDQALTDLCPSRDVLKEISKASVAKIYQARHVIEIEASGHEVLPGILEEFVRAGEFLLRKGDFPRKYKNIALLFPEEILVRIQNAGTPYTMLRLVLDFVSGLTDRHAISLYRKIKGIGI